VIFGAQAIFLMTRLFFPSKTLLLRGPHANFECASFFNRKGGSEETSTAALPSVQMSRSRMPAPIGRPNPP
jgi:hypothetical protein